jgi:hypothetical protein
MLAISDTADVKTGQRGRTGIFLRYQDSQRTERVGAQVNESSRTNFAKLQ